jgi:DNA-binding transcriptional ArsR family regulator
MIPLREPLIDQASALFRALGDASRLRLLKALLEAGEPLSQGAAAQAAELSQANASKHLACLVREGLVTRTQVGNTVLFAPVSPVVSSLCTLVCDHVSGRIQASFESLG